MNDNHSDISWHAKSIEDAMRSLQTNEEGLSDTEAEKRLLNYGRNELKTRKKKSIGRMLLEQIMDVMVLVLVGAAVLSMLLGEWTEAIVIFTIIVVDAVIGVIQENKASNALEALKQMSAPTACAEMGKKVSFLPVKLFRETLYCWRMDLSFRQISG